MKPGFRHGGGQKSYENARSLLLQSDRFTYEGATASGNPSVAGCNLTRLFIHELFTKIPVLKTCN